MFIFNKTIYLIVLFILVNLNAQLAKIEIDIKGNFTAIIESKDTSIELTYRGKLVDFDASGQISYDFSGKPINIGSTQITYDSGRVNSIGSIQMNYDFTGRIISVGSTQIAYDLLGNVAGIGSTKILYDLGRVISIGSTKITYDWPGRVLTGGNFISSEGIVFKFKCFQ